MASPDGSAASALRLALISIALGIVVGVGTSCSPGEGTPRTGARGASTKAESPESGTDGRPVRPPALQLLPRDWGNVDWAHSGIPRRPPAVTSDLVSVLDAPGPARLAYHTVERLTDQPGWGGERIVFLGVDRRWRVLDMADLGLPVAWWPGPDTYGAGRLSADGRMWAAHTNAGVVFVNLADGTFRHVELPGRRSMVRYLVWIPGQRAISAYARAPHGRRYRTVHIRPNGRVTEVAYPGPRTRFDVDGTPVAIDCAPGRQITVTRWRTSGPRSHQWNRPFGCRRGSLIGVFGQTGVALVETSRGSRGYATLWVLDPHTGEPRARLKVPGSTSIEGWNDRRALVLLIDNQRLVAWDPTAKRVRLLLELPSAELRPGEWAAASVALAGS